MVINKAVSSSLPTQSVFKSNLNVISEVLNLNFDSSEWRMLLGSGKRGSTKRQEGMVIQVHALLPSPSETRTDLFGADRPLLNILRVLFFSLYFRWF
jgi:hypothetical protein